MLSKYIIYVDYLSTSSIASEYIEIPSKKLEDAILAADRIFDSEKHYLISIMSKTSPVTSRDGVASVEYTAVMNRRYCGWRLCSDDSGEYQHRTKKSWFRGGRNCSSEPWYNEL